MSSRQPARRAARLARSAVVAAVVVAGSVVLVGYGHQSSASSDGVVPDGTTVFADVPAVANLDPHLLRALRRAATEAEADGVEVYVNSGWRSAKYQEELFAEAVSKYGSAEAAAHWVARPGTSAHESGDAVDVGHSDAAAWLSAHGSTYGLCRTYRNEPWHFELRPGAVDHGCPPMYADAVAAAAAGA